jgi:hypothetical protein
MLGYIVCTNNKGILAHVFNVLIRPANIPVSHFLIADVSYASSPLLRCEFWEMDESLPDLKSLCSGFVEKYRFIGALKYVESPLEIFLENEAIQAVNRVRMEKQDPVIEQRVPSPFTLENEANGLSGNFEYVKGVFFQCFKVPDRLQSIHNK